LSLHLVRCRDFHLVHRVLGIPVGSWVAVEPNGMGLPSREDPPGLWVLLSMPSVLVFCLLVL
jgi:hypothetical protein